MVFVCIKYRDDINKYIALCLSHAEYFQPPPPHIPQVFSPPWTVSQPRLTFHQLEEQPIGTALTTLTASDADSAIEAFALAPNAYFAIDNRTGTIRSTARLDYEQVKEVALVATVTDTGVPQLTATARILVDVINANDNWPVFEEPVAYNWTVLENAPGGTVVGTVRAVDADDGLFGELQYALQGEEARNFHVDADTGVVTVANAEWLDRERRGGVQLTAVAQDKAPITTRKMAAVPVSGTRILDM